MRLIRAVSLCTGLLLGCLPAYAASVPLLTGPQDPSQLNNTINGVINNLNAILIPLTGGAPGASPVNTISLAGAVTGATPAITLAATSDANAGLALVPNGSGSIVLFGQSNTGILQFGSRASFISAPGLSPLPPELRGARIFGVKETVQGMFLVKDWLGLTHGIPVY